jgi:hypothetical protein
MLAVDADDSVIAGMLWKRRRKGGEDSGGEIIFQRDWWDALR